MGVSCRILYSFVVNLYVRGAIQKFVEKLNIFFLFIIAYKRNLHILNICILRINI